MGNSLWFITILQEKPWLGFIIGLCFMAVMFLSKNLIVYLYSRNQEKKGNLPSQSSDLKSSALKNNGLNNNTSDKIHLE